MDAMSGRFYFLCVFWFIQWAAFAVPVKEVNAVKKILTLKNLNYSDPQLADFRKRVQKNIKDWYETKSVTLKWYRYKLKKKDNFFILMARTMLNHETIASSNRLSTYWDLNTGDVWILPDMRGTVQQGSRQNLAKEYGVSEKNIMDVPGLKDYYFIPGMHFEEIEKKYLGLSAFKRPVAGTITSNYGSRHDPFSNKTQFHKGIDLRCNIGTPVIAAAEGKVVFVGEKTGYGKTIILEHHSGYQTLYGHLSRQVVKKGQHVTQLQKIGLSGNTGLTTGPHLHFEVLRKGRAVRPGLN